jgi:hypothetical protein
LIDSQQILDLNFSHRATDFSSRKALAHLCRLQGKASASLKLWAFAGESVFLGVREG